MRIEKKISVVLPAFNEEKNIAQAIDDFLNLKIFDEIIVVDNNSTDNTALIASSKKIKVIPEKKQGYGFALLKGMKEASGDYIILCEPDGTFIAEDALELLKYINSYDMVIGTRTNTKYISENSNMKIALRSGNKILAKFIEILYNPGCSLSDCGCTFRIMKKSVFKKLSSEMKHGGSYFLAEFLALTIISGFSILEIPVHYRQRIGKSKITGSLNRSIIVGIQMFLIIIKYKVRMILSAK